MNSFNPAPLIIPPVVDLPPRVEAARRLLDSVIGAANLSVPVIADAVMASVLLIETPAPPPPLDPQEPSQDVLGDLRTVVGLLSAEANDADTVVECIRLARIARQVQEALRTHEERQAPAWTTG